MEASGWALVVAAIALVVLVDRLVARWPPTTRRRPRSVRASGGGPLGELLAVFAPSVRHVQEETERRRHDLVLPGDADRPWDVDLDSGIAQVSPRPAAAGPQASGGRELTEVAPGVWTATSGLWRTMTTVVVEPAGACLVVDPGVTPAEVAALADELARRDWRPVAGFSTHPHWDHLLWAAALGDVPRWGTPEAVDEAELGRPAAQAEAEVGAPGHDPALTGRLTALPPAPPGPSGTPGPPDAAELPWPGRPAAVIPYTAHCRGSAALALPTAGVLVAGDMLSDVEVPLLDLGADDPVADHLAALDVLEAVIGMHRLDVVVPGHGTVARGQDVARRFALDRSYLAALRRPGSVTDPRLDDDEMRAEHEKQVAALGRRELPASRGAAPRGDGER